jgi:hypothetical protein
MFQPKKAGQEHLLLKRERKPDLQTAISPVDFVLDLLHLGQQVILGGFHGKHRSAEFCGCARLGQIAELTREILKMLFHLEKSLAEHAPGSIGMNLGRVQGLQFLDNQIRIALDDAAPSDQGVEQRRLGLHAGSEGLDLSGQHGGHAGEGRGRRGGIHVVARGVGMAVAAAAARGMRQRGLTPLMLWKKFIHGGGGDQMLGAGGASVIAKEEGQTVEREKDRKKES